MSIANLWALSRLWSVLFLLATLLVVPRNHRLPIPQLGFLGIYTLLQWLSLDASSWIEKGRTHWERTCGIFHTCMHRAMGFMVYIWMMFCTVISQIFWTCISVVVKLLLWAATSQPPQSHVHHFGSFWDNDFFVTLTAVELSGWMGLHGCGHPMSMRVCRASTILWGTIKSAVSSASTAKAMTNLMMVAIVKTVQLKHGIGLYSER